MQAINTIDKAVSIKDIITQNILDGIDPYDPGSSIVIISDKISSFNINELDIDGAIAATRIIWISSMIYLITTIIPNFSDLVTICL